MSYSFAAQAPSKDELIEKFDRQWDSIVEGQPVHKADRDVATCAFKALVDTLPDDPTQDVLVRTNGSVSYTYPDWKNEPDKTVVRGIDVTLFVTLTNREPK